MKIFQTMVLCVGTNEFTHYLRAAKRCNFNVQWRSEKCNIWNCFASANSETFLHLRQMHGASGVRRSIRLGEALWLERFSYHQNARGTSKNKEHSEIVNNSDCTVSLALSFQLDPSLVIADAGPIGNLFIIFPWKFLSSVGGHRASWRSRYVNPCVPTKPKLLLFLTLNQICRR